MGGKGGKEEVLRWGIEEGKEDKIREEGKSFHEKEE